MNTYRIPFKIHNHNKKFYKIPMNYSINPYKIPVILSIEIL